MIRPRPHRPLAELLSIYNRATNPAVHRSDLEHRRNAQLARAVDAELKRRHLDYGRDWTESDSGRRWPAKRYIGQQDLF